MLSSSAKILKIS